MSQLTKTLKSLFRKFGLDVRRSVPDDLSFSHCRNQILASNGISLVLDVGANYGQYSTNLRAMGYEGRILSFEPLPQAFRELLKCTEADRQWEARNIALGDADTTLEFNVAGNTQSSSFLPMSERHISAYPTSGYVEKTVVPVARLDTIRPEIMTDKDRVCLKLDVQGYEMNVLRGGLETLSQVRVAELELCLTALYEGQALPGEMITYMHSLGFDLASLDNADIEPTTGHVLYTDALFVRR